MKPAVAAAAWTTGTLIDTSKIWASSSRRQSSPVSDQGRPGSIVLPSPGADGAHHDDLGVIDLLVRHAEQEQELFLGEETGDRVIAGGHALDQPLGHGHRQRRRLDDPFVARVGLDLEAAVLAPERRHAVGIDRAKLDRAIVPGTDDSPGAGDHALLEQLEIRCVEEVDVTLVAVELEAIRRERQLDLIVGDRGLDLDAVRAGHGPGDLPSSFRHARHVVTCFTIDTDRVARSPDLGRLSRKTS